MLSISPKSLAIISRHALDAYPCECCGVLLGEREEQQCRVAHVVPCRNVHATPAYNYSIDPADLISIQRDSRDMHLEIVGFYHSHPDHSPDYSETDLQDAHWNGCSYLIVGVERRGITTSKSFVLHADGKKQSFIEEPLFESANS